MIEILSAIAFLLVMVIWLLKMLLDRADAIIKHLNGIDAKTITAVADVGSSWSRDDETEWQIEQDNLKKATKQLLS